MQYFMTNEEFMSGACAALGDAYHLDRVIGEQLIQSTMELVIEACGNGTVWARNNLLVFLWINTKQQQQAVDRYLGWDLTPWESFFCECFILAGGLELLIQMAESWHLEDTSPSDAFPGIMAAVSANMALYIIRSGPRVYLNSLQEILLRFSAALDAAIATAEADAAIDGHNNEDAGNARSDNSDADTDDGVEPDAHTTGCSYCCWWFRR